MGVSLLLSDFSSEISSRPKDFLAFSYLNDESSYELKNEMVFIPFTLLGTIKLFLLNGFENSSMISSSSISSSIWSQEFHRFIAEMQTVAIWSSSLRSSFSLSLSSSLSTYSSPLSPTLNISLMASVFISKLNPPIFGQLNRDWEDVWVCSSYCFSSSRSLRGLRKSNLDSAFLDFAFPF